MLGLTIVGVIYLAINAVYLYALPMSGIASETAVAQAAGSAMFSPGAARWLALLIAISCFGAMAPCIMSGARVYYAMAEDGIFFSAWAFNAVSEKPKEALFGIGIVLLEVPFYLYWYLTKKRAHAAAR